MSVAQIKSNSGYLGPDPKNKTHEFMIIDQKAYRIYTVTVHKFRMGDVDDPELYAAQPIWEWQQSEMGQWVMKHAVETPMWQRALDYHSFGHQYAIIAKLKDKDYTFWQLKWG